MVALSNECSVSEYSLFSIIKLLNSKSTYQAKWICCGAIVVRKQKRGRLGGAQ